MGSKRVSVAARSVCLAAAYRRSICSEQRSDRLDLAIEAGEVGVSIRAEVRRSPRRDAGGFRGGWAVARPEVFH